MIQIKYVSLFEFELLHDYYTDKLCRDFQIIPSAQCRNLLQQSGLRFIAADTGGKVFAKVNEAGAKNFIKSPVPENTSFTFLLCLKNKSFPVFTNTKLDAPVVQHYYFNNLKENIDAAGLLHIVNDNTVHRAGNSDLIKFISGSYRFISSADIPEQDVKINWTDTTESLQQILDKENAVSRKQFSFDLRNSSTGRAKLFTGADEADSFYIADAADRKDVFGVIEIFYRSTLSNTYQFLVKDNATGLFEVRTKKYVVHFVNRQSLWRYNVQRKFNNSVTGINIQKNTNPAISFIDGGSAIPGSFIMHSQNPVPFTEEPVTGVKLLDQAGNELIGHLPNASLNTLKQEAGNLFSDIYITI